MKPKPIRLLSRIAMMLFMMMLTTMTAWATDPVTKTYAFSTRSIESNGSVLKMTDPDDNTSKTVITAGSNNKFTNNGSDLQIGAGGHFTIYPNINGKVTRVELTHMGRLSIMMNGSFSMSISGMTCNGNASLTGDGDYEGEGTSKHTNEDASFTFVSTDAAGINGNLSMELGSMAIMLIRSGCELKITYIPSAAPVHAHDFTYTLVGNTLTATCGGTDGLECSLTNHQISTSLTADDAFDSDPSMLFPATLTNFAPFSTETGATKGNITYVNNTTSENLGTTMPSDPGQYTASITVNAGGTGYTLTKTYNVYSYAQINNIYPQLNISTDKYASTTAAGANETVTITFTSKFGETLTTLTVTGATTNMSIGSGITSIGNNKYTFTMPAEEVNIGATFSISEDDFAETGTNEYTIKTANGWGWFCFAVSYDLAPDGFSGKTVKLGTSVGSSEMAGKSGHPFKGTFDGQNYTLTFNRTAAEHHSAPFHYINGATISNLHVQGTITGGTYENLGGLVGRAEGNITIENCHVNTEISTTVSGSALHGGVIAQWNGTNATCTVTGCVYDGLIYNPNEAGVTTSCRGFIGWDYGNNGTITFTDCLSAPAAYGTGKYALGDNCLTFVYPNSEPTLTYHMTNCYYTSTLGNRQGRPAATATVAPDNLGNATTDHGMVKGYKNGFLYDGNYYTPKYGDAVVEYRFNEWNERADVTINGTNNQGTGVNVVGVNITEEVGNIKSVTYNRPFTAAQASTVILPFNYICNGSEGGTFYEFVGVEKDGIRWVATMKETDPGSNKETTLTANTPYLFMPDDATTMTFPNIVNMTGGVVTLLPTTDDNGGNKVTPYDGFEMRGTYTEKVWEENDPEIGKSYLIGDGGELIPVTAGTKIRPTECYIIQTAGAQDAINGLTYNTEGGYYEISDAQDLVDLATYVNGTDDVSIGKTFRQTANIDMSSVNNFDPIGSIGGSKSFKGTYDGGNFTISNLTISNNYGAIGLFGMIKDATIRNIVLVSPTVGAVNPGGHEVCLGALIGVCDKISGTNTVYNCHVISPTLTVSGTSSGTNNIGAIIGEIYNKTTVTNCYYYSNATEYDAIGKYDSDATLTNVARVYQLTLNNCTAATADLTVGSVNYCKEGTEVTLTITPAEGYSIGTVKYNDGSDHEITPTNDVYSFTMPASDVTVSATYTFTVVTPQLDSDGYYLIGTAAELYGFAQLVNNGNATANAKLTADIVVNENVLDANGDANTGDFEQWTPIGNDRYHDKVYSGTFDGQGHTISGLYVSGSGWNVGLIGTADGSVVVKNLGVVDSYFGSSNNHIGSIVGGLSDGSSVTLANVYSTSTVAGDNYIGGLVGGDGTRSVTIINSYFAGKTSSTFQSGQYGTHHDDLVSGSFNDSNLGTLNIVNTFVLGTSLYGTQAEASQLTDGTVAAALHYYQDALADGSIWGVSGGKTGFSGTIDGVSVTTADITLHTFDGNTTAYSSKYVVGNTTPLPVNVEREGYTFLGWYDNANFEGDAVTQISSSATGNKEYWAKFVRSHTVSFILDGGTIGSGEIDHYNEGETTVLPTVVTKNGASFEGWYTTENFTGDRYYSIPATATEDMTFYAKWGAAKTTFYLTQGSPEPVNILYEGENIVWLDETTSQVDGYRILDNHFNPWGSDGSSINVPYTGGESTFDNNGRIFCVAQSGFYVFTLTDKGEGNWFISVYPTVTTSYVDADGTLHENVLAIPLDGSEPADEHGCVELSAGTYYVGNTNPDGVDASYTCLVFNGPATLILGDGATMSVNQTVSNAEALFVGANAPLTIYGQTLGTGTLTVNNSGGLSGIRSSSDITINGGIIETMGSYGIHSYSNITLNGGTITATGTTATGIMAEGTSTRITLGGATVTSNSYSAGSITIVDGMGYVDGTGAVYYGTLWSEAKAAIANKTLTKDMSWTNLKAAFEAGGTQTVTLTNNVIRINSDHIEPSGTVTLDLNGYTIDGGTSQTNPIFKVYNGVSMTITDSQTGGNLCNAGINETVFVGEGGTLTLQSGTIHDSSWGVIVDGSFIMTGGTITGGTVSGVYLYGDNATFTMTGGTITGNAVGVDVNSATATFTVSGNVNITGNTKNSITTDVSLYYDGTSFNPIRIGGALDEAARIGINIDDYAANAITGSVVMVFTDGLKGYGSKQNFTLNGRDGHKLVIVGTGEVGIVVNTWIYDMTLADNADNSTEIANHKDETVNVTLADRTLYKDGKWNTLCLPFALSAEQIAAHTDFSGATLMELDTDGKNGFDPTDGTLYLTFKAATAIAAGVPYLVKWEKAADYEGNEANYDISNPVFEGVTVSSTAAQAVESTTAGLESVQMVGCYSPVSVTADDKSILFLGDANTLYYSTTDRQIRSCRAYFSVPYIKGNAGAKARAFALNFDGEDVTGILGVTADSTDVKDGVWYSLDGVRLSGKPTQRGLYINNGKKVVIK